MSPKRSPPRPSPPSELERYPRPSLAVDVVALTVASGQLSVALYKRADPPERGHFALPGGFMHIDESIEEAANRVMAQKVGLAGVFLEQLYTFGDLRRDPRGAFTTRARRRRSRRASWCRGPARPAARSRSSTTSTRRCRCFSITPTSS